MEGSVADGEREATAASTSKAMAPDDPASDLAFGGNEGENAPEGMIETGPPLRPQARPHVPIASSSRLGPRPGQGNPVPASHKASHTASLAHAPASVQGETGAGRRHETIARPSIREAGEPKDGMSAGKDDASASLPRFELEDAASGSDRVGPRAFVAHGDRSAVHSRMGPVAVLVDAQSRTGTVQGPDGTLSLRFDLAAPVPWQAAALVEPPRLVVDLALGAVSPTQMKALSEKLRNSGEMELHIGPLYAGWWRLVFLPRTPYRLVRGEMRTDEGSPEADKQGSGRALLQLEFAQGRPEDGKRAMRLPAGLPPLPERGPSPTASPGSPRRLKVAIDPGHGGIDPGAEHGGLREADITLALARELAEALRRRNIEVILTREDDSFVPLERRMSIARAAGADILVSLHADALASGQARGVSIHTFAPEASDEAARALVERHGRGDILAGLDLSRQDDTIAALLADLAMRETLPRSEALAGRMVLELEQSDIRLLGRPRIHGAYAVLKSPEIPSVLVEAGFLSNPNDRELLADPGWRQRLADALARAITRWALEDAGRAMADPLRAVGAPE